MSLIEGVGDEVTIFLVIILSTIVIYLAWCSTNVRYELPRAAVLIIESNRRRYLERETPQRDTLSIRKFFCYIKKKHTISH